MCRLSVIVPLYNGEKTIERCLDSLCRQTIEDMEILVVNDGSGDKGPDIVYDYMKKDDRIRMISQKNQGLGAARNFGIREAAGKYVGFVDCDDFVDPNMFCIMVSALEKTNTAVAVCQEKNVYVENGEIQFINETQFPVSEETVYASDIILKWMLNYTYMSLNSMCYKVVERDLFKKYNIQVPEKYRHAEDIVASVGIFSHVARVVVVPQSLYYYVHVKSSISYAYSLRHAEDVYLDWKDSCKYILKSGKKINMANFSLGMYFTSMKQLGWTKNREEKKSMQAKILKKRWRAARRYYKWKPDFTDAEIPVLHKVKIIVAYFELCRPAFVLMQWLKWIPMFKYLA